MIARGLVAMLFVATIGAPAVGQDADRGTAEEAQAMVARAIELYDREGLGESFRRITLTAEFKDRDLYVFVLDTAGTVAAIAGIPEAVGSNALGAFDPDGTFYVQEILKRATPAGSWVDYIFIDPLTNQLAPKSTWAVSHDNFIFACGIYAGEVGI
jgi:signal transduction histidine kinase